MRARQLHMVLAVALELGAASACSTSEPTEVTTSVGPDGGTVELSSALSLQIPPGALTEDTQISFRIDPGAQSIDGALVLTPIYRFEPDGLVFSLPVQVRFQTTDTFAPGSQVLWSSADGGFEPIATQLSEHVAIADVTHFSRGWVGYYFPIDSMRVELNEGTYEVRCEASGTYLNNGTALHRLNSLQTDCTAPIGRQFFLQVSLTGFDAPTGPAVGEYALGDAGTDAVVGVFLIVSASLDGGSEQSVSCYSSVPSGGATASGRVEVIRTEFVDELGKPRYRVRLTDAVLPLGGSVFYVCPPFAGDAFGPSVRISEAQIEF